MKRASTDLALATELTWHEALDGDLDTAPAYDNYVTEVLDHLRDAEFGGGGPRNSSPSVPLGRRGSV